MGNFAAYKMFLDGKSSLTYEELPKPDETDDLDIYMYGLCGVSQNVIHGPDHYVPAAQASAERAEAAALLAEEYAAEMANYTDITIEELDEFCQ